MGGIRIDPASALLLGLSALAAAGPAPAVGLAGQARSSGPAAEARAAALPAPTEATAAVGARLDTIRVVDDAGRAVALAEPAGRVVSLVPALTETLFAIGAGDRLVGRTRFDLHPPEVRAVPDVGDGIRPSTEAVRALDPDLVLLYAGPDNRGVLEAFDRVGLRTLAVRHDRLAHLRRNVRRLGRLTGCAAGAEALLGRIDAGLARVARATADLAAPAVYYDVWGSPPTTVGAGSYLDSLLALSGARNVFGDLEPASPRVSLEAIAARDPDLILWPVDPRAEEERVSPARRPGWRALRAVRADAVRRVDGDLVHRLGPRIAAAAAALAAAIHPEVAAELAEAAPASGTEEPAEAWRSTGPAGRATCRTGR